MAESALPGDIRESVAIGNVKSVAEQPSLLSNLTYSNTIANINLSQQNAVSQQQAMNQITTSVAGKMVNLVSNINPMEAVAVLKMTSGNELAGDIADLKAVNQPNQPAPPKPAS